MKVDITALMNKRTDKLDFGYELDPYAVECDIILPEDVSIPSPVFVSGCVKDQNNCMSLACTVRVNYKTQCDRCLDEIDGELCFEFEKTVSESQPPEGFEDDPSYDDIVFVNESSVDIDAAVVEEIALRLPPYHLCSEDCPGLCPKCGKKLSEGDCGCSAKKEIDPRLKILQKLLDNFD